LVSSFEASIDPISVFMSLTSERYSSSVKRPLQAYPYTLLFWFPVPFFVLIDFQRLIFYPLFLDLLFPENGLCTIQKNLDLKVNCPLRSLLELLLFLFQKYIYTVSRLMLLLNFDNRHNIDM